MKDANPALTRAETSTAEWNRDSVAQLAAIITKWAKRIVFLLLIIIFFQAVNSGLLLMQQLQTDDCRNRFQVDEDNFRVTSDIRRVKRQSGHGGLSEIDELPILEVLPTLNNNDDDNNDDDATATNAPSQANHGMAQPVFTRTDAAYVVDVGHKLSLLAEIGSNISQTLDGMVERNKGIDYKQPNAACPDWNRGGYQYVGPTGFFSSCYYVQHEV